MVDRDWWEPRHYWPEPDEIEVEVKEPRKIGEILDRYGKPLHTVMEPRIPFGFHQSEE